MRGIDCQSEVSMEKKRFHYGWIVCLGCTLLLMCTMGLVANAGFSIYMPYIVASGPYSNASVSLIITVRSIFTLIGMFFVNKLYEKTDIRLGVFIACVAAALAFVCYAFARSLIVYYIGGALAGLAYGFGSIIPVAILIKRWFVKKNALAIGICSSGTGLATLIFPNLFTAIIESKGIHISFLVEAALVIAIAVIVFLLLRDYPKEKGLKPLGSDFAPEEVAVETKVVKKAVRPFTNGENIIVIATMILTGAMGILSTANISPLFKSEGIDSQTVASAVSLFGFTLICAKLIVGNLIDKIGMFKANFILGTSCILGMLICCTVKTTGVTFMVIGTFLFGFGVPIATVGLPIWAADFSNSDNYASMLKKLQMSYQVGGLLFSTLPGIFADATGDYIPAYIMFSVFTAIIVIVVSIMYKRLDLV